MDAMQWDERYTERPLVWSSGPNQFLVQEVGELPAGRALDLACGEGRNALWLAEQGWQVTATDFSQVAIDKARALADRRGLEVAFQVADATDAAPGGPYDLVVVFYLQLPGDQRRLAHRNAAAALAPGGTLLVVGHDRDNLDQGVGGPSSPEVLLTTDGVLDDLDGTGLEIVRADQVTRDVQQEDGPTTTAIDGSRADGPGRVSDRPSVARDPFRTRPSGSGTSPLPCLT